MKILSAAQLKAVDAYTIEKELASSTNLMERASRAVADKIRSRWTIDTPMKVFAGPGNNGGDAVAIARMLSEANYKVYVYLFNTSGRLSPDCQLNKQRLLDFQNVKKDMMGVHNVEFTEVTSQFTPPKLEEGDLIIDGLFGTGLSRPLNGGFASVVKYINASPATVVSIDVPSGLMNWEVLDIGLLDPGTEETATFYNFTEKKDMVAMLKTRSKFAHKGTMGHAVLIAGKKGMAGAAILSARACMRSGLGKLTIRVPESNVRIMQEAVPEAVLNIDVDANCFSQSFDTSEFDAMAIGPGIGTSAYTVQAFIEQVSMTKCAMVIDADALNILGSHRGWINQLPRHCILTPHKKELFGLISTTRNSYEELERTRELAVRQRIFILIKGAYSAVVTPLGNVYFNSTGNPGMATAGAGDVLTGVILSLLAQAYEPEVALRLGVYLHGLAGDLAAEDLSYEGLISTDIVNYLPKAFKELRRV